MVFIVLSYLILALIAILSEKLDQVESSTFHLRNLKNTVESSKALGELFACFILIERTRYAFQKLSSPKSLMLDAKAEVKKIKCLM
jgi:hypothetical protein